MLVTSDLEISIQSCLQLPLLLSPSVTVWLWVICLSPFLGGVSFSPTMVMFKLFLVLEEFRERFKRGFKGLHCSFRVEKKILKD